MAVTKLDLRMIDDTAEIYFGDLDSNDAVPVWRTNGTVVYVTYGRLQELLGGGGGIIVPPTVYDGGLVNFDEETLVLDGGLVGEDDETVFLDGGLVA